MATSTKSLSASYMGVTENAAKLFMPKVREAMSSSRNNPMDGVVHLDEFVLGGREEKKLLEATMLRKIGRYSCSAY